MAWGNFVHVTGNVTRDPELRFAASGVAICQFGVAFNKRRKDGDDDVSFFDVVCFRELAENVAESVTKGMRVVVDGELQQRSWETDDGSRRSKVELLADEVAPSLRWASAVVSRNDKKGGGDRSDPGPQPPAPAAQPAAQARPAQRPAASQAVPDHEPF